MSPTAQFWVMLAVALGSVFIPLIAAAWATKGQAAITANQKLADEKLTSIKTVFGERIDGVSTQVQEMHRDQIASAAKLVEELEKHRQEDIDENGKQWREINKIGVSVGKIEGKLERR